MKLRGYLTKFRETCLRVVEGHSPAKWCQKQEQSSEDEDVQINEEELEEKEEEKERELQAKIKIDQFLTLWLQYIVIYNSHFVFHENLINKQVSQLIDIQPSIIKSKSIPQSLVTLINPRISSVNMVGNFKSLKRVMENITSYFFENFLTVAQRGIIAKELGNMRNEGNTINSLHYLDFEQFFRSQKQFASFWKFMNMEFYVDNTRKHELSQAYHSNREYDNETVDRVQQVYDTGIELFNAPGTHLSGFAFDICGSDYCAITMREDGIREIPIRKSFLNRNRSDRGLKVFDAEMNTWEECLHRYDEYPDTDVSQHQAINGAVSKLYHTQTINYSKSNRRNNMMTLLDTEPKPLKMWNNYHCGDFLQH